MRITTAQLPRQIKNTLACVYLLSDDEPLQLQEAHALLVKAARDQGINTRQRFDVTPGFNWATLTTSTQNMSLFADKQLIDLVIANGKPGTAGSQFLCEYTKNPAADTILLIRTGKLDAATLRSKWVQAIDEHGVIIQAWPIPRDKIPQWLTKRLQHVNLHTDRSGLQLLTDYIEGNLLAGAQAIEKLQLLHEQGFISPEHIANAINDSAQYDVFALTDACLQGDLTRSLHILASLREEGNAPTLVLWALAREIRALSTMAFELRNTPLPQVLQNARVWQKRKAITTTALERLTISQLHCLLEYAKDIDCSTKGMGTGNPWDQLGQLCIQLAKPTSIPNLT